MINNIGFMQGRLSPIVDGKIQSFPWRYWENEFLLANNIGIDLIEWTLDYERLYENPIMNSQGQSMIKKLCLKNSINIPSLTGDCFMQSPFWKFSGTKREELKLDFIKILNACSKIGIKIIVVPLVDEARLQNKSEEDDVFFFLDNNTSLIKKLNLRIAFEADLNPADFLNFINRFDPSIFGINYDMGNSAALGYDASEEFNSYGYKIINIHIKDRILNGTTVELGKGSTEFKKIFSLLEKYNYKGNHIMQIARAIDENHEKILLDAVKMIKNIQN